MARIFQDTKAKREMGAKAPWSVEWREGGKRKSIKVGGKMEARERLKQIEVNLLNAKVGIKQPKQWRDFRKWYETTILPGMRSELSRRESRRCLQLFEDVIEPHTLDDITDMTLTNYVAKRRTVRGKKRESTIAAKTLAKECRTISAALSLAVCDDWELKRVPKMPKIDGFVIAKRFMTWSDFNVIWHACRDARMPQDFASPANWWRALLMTFWVTGCRVGALLQAEWQHVDLKNGIILLPSTITKQKRDHCLQVHQAVDNLLAIRPEPATGLVFPWEHHRRTMDIEFDRIQTAAGINLPCNIRTHHVCTPSCHLYNYHDLRRSLATYNHSRMEFEQMMEQMGHSCRATTEGYIVFAEKVNAKKIDVFVGTFESNVQTTCNSASCQS